MTINSGNECIKIALIGAGVRGTHLSHQLALCQQQTKLVGVVEPVGERRNTFARTFGVASSGQFTSWQAFADSSIECDAVIIATMDNQHTEPAIASLKRGCHILIEKPLSDTFRGCILINKIQKEKGLVVSVCHTLRYMEAFRRIRQIVEEGTIGRIVHMEHMEAIGHLRFVHNYVRGRWAIEENNTFLLLHKCSHDVDFVAWIIDSACVRVSSFGSLTYFTHANAPAGSGSRCLDDCRIQDTCLYSAVRLYAEEDLTGRLQDLGQIQTRESRLAAIREGPFGACVWKAGNNVVDHQVVSMEFSNGATATCTLSGYSATHGRRTRLHGTKGELLFEESAGSIMIRQFARPEPDLIQINRSDSYHPEDKEIVENWLSAINGSSEKRMVVDSQEAMRTHAIVFAAELSRKENRVVEMSELNEAFGV